MQSECLHRCLYVTLSAVSGKSEVIDRVNHVKGQGSNNTALCSLPTERHEGNGIMEHQQSRASWKLRK